MFPRSRTLPTAERSRTDVGSARAPSLALASAQRDDTPFTAKVVHVRDIPLDQLEFSHFQALQADDVREGPHLDYKWELPTNWNDEAKREFLADVSSFANAGGGDIVWGVEEAKDANNENTGAIKALHGLPDLNEDAVTRNMQQILATGLDPKVPGISFRAIPTGTANVSLLVMRIPQSWIGPHMVTFRDSAKFFTRSNGRKHRLDVRELRAAFVESESAGKRAHQFRLDRIAKVVSDDTPVPTRAGARWCIHLIPVAAPDGGQDFVAGAKLDDFRPVESPGGASRYNLDGFVCFVQNLPSRSYVQVFRHGAVEVVDAGFLDHPEKLVPSARFEVRIVKHVNQYVTLLRRLGVQSRLAASISLLGVRNFTLGVNRRTGFDRDEPSGFDRNEILLPEIIVETDQVLASDLRPTLDLLWQSAGWERSRYFNELGEWTADK